MEKTVSSQIHNISYLFFRQAELHPDTIALIDKDGSTISYSELARDIVSTAASLHEKGIKRGDRVLIFIPMSVDLYRVVLALFYMGATAVFLDEWVNRKRLALCCELASCKAMIGSRKALFLTWFLRPLRKLSLRLTPNLPMSDATFPPVEVEAEETALITFTTGSTGTPKAADRSHAFLKAQFEALQTEINPQPGDIAMPVLPIVLLINLGAGATSVIADFPARKPEKMKPEKLYRQLIKHQVTRITSSPFVVDKLASWMQATNQMAPKVRQVFTGGAPVFPAMARNLSNAFEAEIKVVFGSTEAEPISMASAEDVIEKHLPGKGLYVGHIYEGCELAIIPMTSGPISPVSQREFNSSALKEYDVGEIVVAGKHVLKKYIDNPQAWLENKIQVEDQIWHRTGDAGFLDKSGNLFLVGRVSRVIKTDAGLIAPFLIEQELTALDSVTLGTVLDTHDGLVMVLESSASSVDVSSDLLNQLGLPTQIRQVVVSNIPRDPRHHGKIDYSQLEGLIVKKKML